MPPKSRFTATFILEAALQLVREQGIEALTARNLAQNMGASTGPIFRAFASMDALKEGVVERAIALFVTRAQAQEHADPLVGASIAWLAFAKSDPKLYEALFLRHHAWHNKWGPVRRLLADAMATAPDYARLDKRQRFALVGRVSIVLHGLGVEVWSGRLPHDDFAFLIEQLVTPVIEHGLRQHKLLDLHTLAATI